MQNVYKSNVLCYCMYCIHTFIYTCTIRYGDRVHFGRVDGELVKREMPPSESGRSFVMVCGTRSFVSDMKSHLEPAGYSQDKIYVF